MPARDLPRAALLPLLLAALYLATGAASGPTQRYSSDSYQYALTAQAMLGVDPAVAHHRALVPYCHTVAESTARAAERDPMRLRAPDARGPAYAKCMAAHPDRLWPDSPRYRAIFAPRVGYPALAVPAVAALGVGWGLWLTSALLTAGAGLLLWLLLRRLGASPAHAALGQGLLYVSPVGTWGTWALAEGLTYAGTVASLLGAWLLLDRQARLGATVTAAGLIATTAAKYSTGMALSAALGAVALVLLCLRTHRHGGTVLLAAGAWSAAVAAAGVSLWRGWPGTAETMQDKWTLHFDRPDVPDPWARWWELSAHFWTQWWDAQLAAPMLLAGLALGLWGLRRRGTAALLLVAGAAATGVAAQVLHPVASQGTRLIAVVWLVVAVGVPLLLGRRSDVAPGAEVRPSADDSPERATGVTAAAPSR